MSDSPPQPAGQDGHLLLALLSLAGLAVVAWSCLLAWAGVELALRLVHWLS